MQGQPVLLVDADPAFGRALALVLRSQGLDVSVVQSRSQALQAVRQRSYGVALVDLFVPGGGLELARDLSRQVPRLLLTVGAQLATEELLEAVLGFPVHRKAALPGLLKVPGASSSDKASGVTRPESRRPRLVSSAPAPGPSARARRRDRRPA